MLDWKLVIDRIAKINVSFSNNFSFDKNGDMIMPTNDNKLLLIDANTFQLIRFINLQEDLAIYQIDYLPLKQLFVCASKDWEIILLSDDYNFISRTDAEDCVSLPKINEDESLISFFSYDQVEHYDLYSLDDDLSLTYVDTFFETWENTSSGFAFNKNEFAVSFPNVLAYYSYENGLIRKQWSVDSSKMKAEKDFRDLIMLDGNTIVLGKGRTLVYIDKVTKSIFKEVKLNLSAEIRNLYVSKEKEFMIISTDNELELIKLQ